MQRSRLIILLFKTIPVDTLADGGQAGLRGVDWEYNFFTTLHRLLPHLGDSLCKSSG